MVRRAVEEGEQAGAMLAMPGLEAAGVGGGGLVVEESAEDEAINGIARALFSDRGEELRDRLFQDQVRRP